MPAARYLTPLSSSWGVRDRATIRSIAIGDSASIWISAPQASSASSARAAPLVAEAGEGLEAGDAVGPGRAVEAQAGDLRQARAVAGDVVGVVEGLEQLAARASPRPVLIELSSTRSRPATAPAKPGRSSRASA
jgi:hypothetical protein